MTQQKMDKLQKKAATNFAKGLNEIRCPLCMGIDSFIWTGPSVGKEKFDMSLAEPLKCKMGHNLSVLGFNSEDVFLISVMDVHTRPVKS